MINNKLWDNQSGSNAALPTLLPQPFISSFSVPVLYYCHLNSVCNNMPKSSDTTTNSFCDCCNQWFDQRGFTAHQVACLKKADQRRKDAIFDAKMQDLASRKRLREGTVIIL